MFAKLMVFRTGGYIGCFLLFISQFVPAKQLGASPTNSATILVLACETLIFTRSFKILLSALKKNVPD